MLSKRVAGDVSAMGYSAAETLNREKPTTIRSNPVSRHNPGAESTAVFYSPAVPHAMDATYDKAHREPSGHPHLCIQPPMLLWLLRPRETETTMESSRRMRCSQAQLQVSAERRRVAPSGCA